MNKRDSTTEILRIVNGSRLYGNFHKDSDYDYIAIYVEDPEIVFSDRKIETLLLHNRHPEAKSSQGEIDGTGYSLRHFIKLALNGNPSILTTLFAPENFWVISTFGGDLLMENADLFVSMNASKKFLGYMRSQLLRLQGIKVGHIPNRPELVEQYGYDTKYAMSVARLGLQGIEYFTTGTIQSPMNKWEIEYLTGIRHGSHTYEEIIDQLEDIEILLKQVISKSKLPDEPDYKEVYALSKAIHEYTWSVK